MADLPAALRKTKSKQSGSVLSSSRDELKVFEWLAFKRRVSASDIADATRSLAVMIGARLPVVDALTTAARQSKNERLSDILQDIARRVERGSSLADAFASYDDQFGRFYSRLVHVGEVGGVLDNVLYRLATYLEKSYALRRRIRLALVYPGVILSVAVAAVAFLLAVIVPTFAELFADFDAELPLPTRIIVGVSDVLTSYYLLAIVLAVGVWFGLRLWSRTDRGRSLLDTLKLKLPVSGALYLKGITARFCRTLSTMLHSGVPLVDALSVTEETIENVHVSSAIWRMRKQVVKGRSLSSSQQKESPFPPMVVQMITVGEETAQLDEMLAHVAEHYESEVDSSVEALTSVIEPALILLLGLVIGSILVAIYLPMFDLVTVIE